MLFSRTLHDALKSLRSSFYCVMPLATSILLWSLAMPPDGAYSTRAHTEWISQSFKESTSSVTSAEDGNGSAGKTLAELGRTMAESRKWQGRLTTYLKSVENRRLGGAFAMVRTAGLFDAYLTSAVFSLDGDADSREMRMLLERKIAKLLQKK